MTGAEIAMIVTGSAALLGVISSGLMGYALWRANRELVNAASTITALNSDAAGLRSQGEEDAREIHKLKTALDIKTAELAEERRKSVAAASNAALVARLNAGVPSTGPSGDGAVATAEAPGVPPGKSARPAKGGRK